MGTSITSGGDRVDQQPTTPAVLAENPHIKYYNGQRGYVSCDITPKQWRSDYRIVPFVSRPGAPVLTHASFVVEAGQPGVVQTSEGSASAVA